MVAPGVSPGKSIRKGAEPAKRAAEDTQCFNVDRCRPSGAQNPFLTWHPVANARGYVSAAPSELVIRQTSSSAKDSSLTSS